MTNEQAINWLVQIKGRYIFGGDEKFDELRREALDLGIKALQLHNFEKCTIAEGTEKQYNECRNRAIEKDLPLYFIYYEKTGVCEIYITKTRELFEKRHCTKHLSSYEFQEIATRYLDEYSNWKGGEK